MRIAFMVSCLLLASTVDAKDLIVRQRSSTGLGGPALGEETVYIAGDRLVTDSASMRIMVDLAQKTITSIDKSRQVYTVLTFDDLRAQMDALRKTLESLPPESRKQLGALFDEGSPVTVKETGKTETIAGYTAKEYALSGAPYSGSIWTTTAIATPPAFRKWKGIEQSQGGAAKRLGEAMEKLEGFPVRTRIEVKSGDKPIVLSNEVVEIKDGSPPSELLTVPPGFTKQAARPPTPPPPPSR